LFLKNGINQNGEPLIFGGTGFTIKFKDPILPLQCTTFMEQ